jgi:hypothetical protein
VRFESERAIGSGLELDGELLQLSAFMSDHASARSDGSHGQAAGGHSPGMDVRDQDVAELLRTLIDEVRLSREQTTALLEAMLRKLDSLERSQYG